MTNDVVHHNIERDIFMGILIQKEKIISILTKYEDSIMECTMGDKIDVYGTRYTNVYSSEWNGHKQDLAYLIDKLLINDYSISAEGLAYIIISHWYGVMTIDKQCLDVSKLKKLCKKILKDIEE
jgi:hypothetical protein